MLTGEQLHDVWSIAYRTGGMLDVGAWEDDSEESRGAWNALAKWIEQYDKHTRNCPFRTGKMECKC